MLKNYLLLLGILLLIWSYQSRKQTSHITTLIRQTARWAVASQQDKNPLIAVLHANYAVGFLSALKQITTDTEIERVTGLDILKFERMIYSIQDSANRKATAECPSFAPPGKLAKIAGDR